ncbi:hypothetical protein IGI04_036408 [Brassica rapa subsp. trilocularis]|uniref:Uncharacterized protein n=1 Tax=Brassica rapa subsp. trilocularis TaxID=1813537 RepID=A0ABQ7LEI1_BRACM|nr:hypothetical protein IGI04_036408 [Brassica rapa subsp. trilocularis]
MMYSLLQFVKNRHNVSFLARSYRALVLYSAADKLEYGNRTADKPSSIDTRDRASVPLGHYVTTELFRNVDTTPVHALSSILQCYLPKTVANSVHVFRHSKSSIKLCVTINVSSRNSAQRDLRHNSRPILRFLNQKPVNRRTVYAWFAREDKCQNISILCYDGLRAEENRQCEFWFPQFGARRRGGYGLLLLMATKRLIETMSGYMNDKLAALTAPMVNAYANTVLFNKIENLVATFRHRKSTKTSSRFLFLNIKGNDKSYQTP